MGSFLADSVIVGGVVMTFSGGSLCCNGLPVVAGSGVNTAQLSALSGQSIVDGVLSITVGNPATRLTIDTTNSINAFGSSLRGKRSRGVTGSLSGVLTNDVLLQLVGDGSYGSGFASGVVSITLCAAEDWVSGSNGSYIKMRTTPIGGTGSSTRLLISHNGNVGISSDTPAYTLDVSGSGNFTNGVYWNGVPVLTGSVAVTLLSGSLTQTGLAIGVVSGALDARLTATGLQIGLVSGGLEARIIASGNAVVTQANNNGINLSGVLAQTGATLIARDTNISGAIGILLTTTGQILLGNIVAASGGVAATGQILYAYVTATSGFATGASGSFDVRLATTGQTVQGNVISASGSLALTGQTLYGNVLAVSGNLALTGLAIGVVSGALDTKIAATGGQAWNAADANGRNLSGSLTQTGVALYALASGTSGNLTSTGLQIGLVSGALATLLTATGATLQGQIATLTGNLITSGAQLVASLAALSGNLTTSGSTLYQIFTGASGLANGNGIALSGALTQTGLQIGLLSGAIATKLANTGAALFQRDLDISGVLSTVKVSGSSVIPVADFTGIGTVSVVYSGGKIFVSGAVSVGGSQIDSINLSGQLALTGTNLYNLITNLSGQVIGTTLDKQVLFNSGGLLDGDINFTWDPIGDSLNIGQAVVLPDNPLAIGGSGGGIQSNIQNRSNLIGASSDVVATSDIGSDTSGYLDMGINGSTYNQAAYNITTSGDGYLYINGGDLAMGTQSARKVIKFHTTGTLSGNLRATIDESGINLASGMDIRINNVSVGMQGMAVTLSTGPVSWTNQPAATNFLNAATSYITFVDLAGFTGVNLVVNKGATATAATGAIWLGMRGSSDFTPGNYVPLTANSSRLLTNVANTMLTSGYQPLAAGAKSGVYIALLASGGSAAVTPVFGNIMALFK